MNKDLEAVLADMSEKRASLAEKVNPLSSDDMAKARPGGWSVDRVLQHVIESEASYVKLIAHLRGSAAPDVATTMPQDGRDAEGQLARTRAALLTATDSVDDETLYRLAPLGANEYSVLSVLENVADHDHEHLAQIERLLESRD